MQGTQVQPLVREDPTASGQLSPGATVTAESMLQSLPAAAAEPTCCTDDACVPGAKRGHCNEKSVKSNDDTAQPKISKSRKDG